MTLRLFKFVVRLPISLCFTFLWSLVMLFAWLFNSQDIPEMKKELNWCWKL